MSTQTELLNFTCVNCDGINYLEDDVELNEIIECIDCGSEFEIISISPVEVIEIDMDTEDWGQ